MLIYKKYFLPVGLLAGTIIGAGIFSLPFVFNEAGLSVGYVFLLLAAVVYTAVHLMYAGIILRTEGEHRFVGYAQRHLGQWAFWPAVLMAVVQMIFVLTIYLVLSQSFAQLLAPLGTGFEKMMIFWFLGSLGIFLTLKRLALLELLVTAGIALIILIIFILGLPRWSELSGVWAPHWKNFLMPLGPLLFALSGRVAIPSLVNYFGRKNIGDIKKAIIGGTVLPAIVYGLFVLGVLALSAQVSPDAVSGLMGQVSDGVLAAIGILGLLSLFSSYIVVGLDVNSIFLYDLNFPRWLRFLLVIGAPPLLYLAGLQNFIFLVSFVGGIFLALENIFIAAMWQKISRKPLSPAVIFLFLVFAAAIIYEIIK